MPTIQQFITVSFDNQLQNFKKNEIQLKKGDAILARMKGFDPWPAKIVDFTNDKKIIKCYFFGTHNTGSVGIRNAIPFVDAIETVRLVCLRKPVAFVKGIKEIEIECAIPNEFSCLREFEQIE